MSPSGHSFSSFNFFGFEGSGFEDSCRSGSTRESMIIDQFAESALWGRERNQTNASQCFSKSFATCRATWRYTAF